MADFVWTTELRFVVALFLGLLVGLEREASMADKKLRMFGGVRTFALISLFGFACGWLHAQRIELAIPVGIFAVLALAVVAYFTKTKLEHYGTTSEISALLTFIVGVLCFLADIWLAAAIGIVNALLLSEKSQLEGLVERLDRNEFLAIIKFLIVTVIILPILPNRSFTQFDLNPFHIWRIVVLVSTVGFFGYVLTRKYGNRMGLWLSGVMGGIVSSTAVSVAMGRLAQSKAEQTSEALRATILACSVMYVRILVLIWAINPAFASIIWWRLLMLMSIGIAIALTIKDHHPKPASDEPQVSNLQNPFEIKPAAVFAVLFVLLSVVSQYTKMQFGTSGLFALSAIAGATDIDPYILSLARGNEVLLSSASTAIIIAMMSNTVFKGFYFGGFVKPARIRAMMLFGIWAALHLPLCF